MRPRFSIITCTWNSQPWLAESIASVLQQQGPPPEYIFVDGGSTDGTLAQIAAIPRTVKLAEKVSGGISQAMNRGLEMASGDIIAYLHSDDFYLHPHVLSDVAQAFDTSGCRWLFGRSMRAMHGQLLPENYQAPRYSRPQLIRGNFIPHPATFVTRELMLEAGGFDTALRYAMDYDLWLKLSVLAEPIQIALPLAAFREHEGSLSTRNRIAAMREDLQVRLRHARPNPLQLALHLLRYGMRRQRALHALARRP
jgi:glycosyltransferase involved in cell wall biosynthesis